ncbi:nucleotidyltransferase domain-containing protein [Tenacibaculum soleae]|uniref:Nucleotidyltransferase n=1 Tax=Tenacibaculum soleae TaxID=447689 RepID=A0A1B9Y382_9FLAO|nr:nucleotidyltransferase family protein [Tenacibaculum soleae]MDO6813099.1 nucleotidyltransferase family protein [Tenacibaculum soleae]OCK44226.1 hypothetical protein BA195_05960 [Tenacibaculum soleae]
MNYKDTLLFIGKCLTITHEKHNRELIEKELKLNNIDWDPVVKVSTSHYVFPALYCNLKRVGFLHYLPKDLVEYMQHITDLNRERNQQIITEAKEINEILLKNNITPIFLKGTGNLLDGLYDDIAERMVGDIDFLIDEKDIKLTLSILKEEKYISKPSIDRTIFNRHYPRLVKKDKTGAIEVHYKMTNNNIFNYNYVKSTLKKVKNITVLSNKNQVLMTCFNKQINDKGQWNKNISFRNSYDLYLQSENTSSKDVISNFKYSKKYYFDNFIASTNYFFNSPTSLNYQKTNKTKKFLKKQLFFIDNPKKHSKYMKSLEYYFLYIHRISLFSKSFYIREYRIYLLKRLFN